MPVSYCEIAYGSDRLVYASSADIQISQCRIHHSSGNGLYVDAGLVTLTNTAITDNITAGLVSISTGGIVGIHTTIARNATGVSLLNSSTVNLTSTILAANQTGLSVGAGCTATLTKTLWDANTTPLVGSVSETGHIDGAAAFAEDGFHITIFSAGLNQGVVTPDTIDIDGQPRTGTSGAPDPGADEVYLNRFLWLPIIRK